MKNTKKDDLYCRSCGIDTDGGIVCKPCADELQAEAERQDSICGCGDVALKPNGLCQPCVDYYEQWAAADLVDDTGFTPL